MNAEKEFITRLVNDTDNLGKTAIKPKDLINPAYRAAYLELIKQVRAGDSPDWGTILISLPAYIQELAELNSIETANFQRYEKALSNEIHCRNLKLAAEFFSMAAERGITDPGALAAEMSNRIANSSIAADETEISSMGQMAIDFKAVLWERKNANGKLIGVTTGFSVLDDMFGGFRAGAYYVGGRPSQGKTALMLTMARHAMESGKNVGIISIESSKIDLIARLLSARANVLADNLKTAQFKDGDYTRLEETNKWLSENGGVVYFNTKTDVDTMEAVARVMVKIHKVDIIYVDYLQRVHAPGFNKQEQVANASRAITDIAKGLQVPVVCLAQTGRQADVDGAKPELSHFQHSSAIEQDADVAMIIHTVKVKPNGNPESYQREAREETYLSVLKNRDGEIADVPVFFNKKYARFEEDANR